MRRPPIIWSVLAALVLVVAVCAVIVHGWIGEALSTGPNGPETPASLGVPFERVSIPSGSRRLDGYLVRAPPDCAEPPAILIYHGFEETISKWPAAQAILWRHCVSSLVFDPSGEGDSTKPASLGHLAEDAPAAWAFAREHFPAPTRLYAMGHSLGDAVMLAAEPGLSPQPAGVIVADTFSSLKDFWAAHRTNGLLLAVLPTVWDNTDAIRKVHAHVLVVQSDADRMTPLEQGQRVYAAANPPKSLAVLHGYKHNGLRFHATDAWWAPVLAFVRTPGVSHAPLAPIAAPTTAPAAIGELGAEAAREEALRASAAALAPAPSSAPASGQAPAASPAGLPPTAFPPPAAPLTQP